MAEQKEPPNPNLVYYPKSSELNITTMPKTDRLKHLSSIVGQEFKTEEDFQKYLDSTRTPEQKKLVQDVILAFNANCKQNNQSVLFDKSYSDLVIFLPEKRVQQIADSEDVFSKFVPAERRGNVLGKVLKTGVVIMSSGEISQTARDTRSTIAHELGHVYRFLGNLEKGSDNDLEEPIVELNAIQVSKQLGITPKEHYNFELKLVKALCQKFNIKSMLNLSFDDLTKISQKFYPGEKDGHPNFAWLIEDYLDFMQHTRRNIMLHSYSKDEHQEKEYAQKIFDELSDFGDKWELDMFIEED